MLPPRPARLLLTFLIATAARADRLEPGPAGTVTVVAADGQGRAGRVWLGMLDASHVPVGDPLQVFQGRMDVSEIEYGETISITIALESRLVDWERPRIRRFTDQDQKRAYPGDRGLEYVQAVSDMELVWGRG